MMSLALRMFWTCFALLLVLGGNAALAADMPAGANGTQVLEEFSRQQEKKVGDESGISAHKKQVIMFVIGAPLLLLLLITGGLGIAIGVYGKPWFLAHMILAGLTMSLAVVHVVVGLVWFYPF